MLVDDAKRPEVLKAGNVTLVFYSRSHGAYVHLRQATRKDNVITLEYRFVTHMTLEMSAHLALVPLGELIAGKYEVKIEQLPPRRSEGSPPAKLKRLPSDQEQRIVSQPYTFEVK